MALTLKVRRPRRETRQLGQLQLEVFQPEISEAPPPAIEKLKPDVELSVVEPEPGAVLPPGYTEVGREEMFGEEAGIWAKYKTPIIVGGLAVAGVIGYLVLRKR